ncbi:MAG: NAD(P)H-hydrate epimerase [Phycisphaerales bacterium]
MAASIAFTRRDARAYDAHCMRALGIPGVLLMERAAEGVARIAREMLGGAARARVTVACGAGQNGGDGYRVAELLHGAGHEVRVVFLGEPREGSDAAVMRGRARRAGVPMQPFCTESAVHRAELVVDAVFGTGLDRPLEGDALAFVRSINASGAPVLSIDLPSGMDCDTGDAMPECVHATVTATMVAPKIGFARAGARRVGRVEVVPIGGPPAFVAP